MPLYYTSRNHISHLLYHTLNKQTLRSACGFFYPADNSFTSEPTGRMCHVCESVINAEQRRGPIAMSRREQKAAEERVRLEKWNKAATNDAR